jgi:hypothetical protein
MLNENRCCPFAREVFAQGDSMRPAMAAFSLCLGNRNNLIRLNFRRNAQFSGAFQPQNFRAVAIAKIWMLELIAEFRLQLAV